MDLKNDKKENFKFPKSEKLSSKKLIDEVFKDGNSMFLYPFSIKYLRTTNLEQNQFLISVSKKKFKRAVDRNLIKRRVREAYRLNKNKLEHYNDQFGYLAIAYIYIANQIHNFDFMESKLIESLKRLDSIKASS